MRSLGVVGEGSAGRGLTGVVEAEEQGLVQPLVARPAVERRAGAVSRMGLPGAI